MKRHGITLIELCVVVLVVALLIVIALPNLQLAGTRAKISRVHADFATLRTAVESYRIDSGIFPHSNETGTTPTVLSTPVAYVSSTTNFPDPLYKKTVHGQSNDDNQWLRYNRWAGEGSDDPSVTYHMEKFGAYWMYSNAPFANAPRETVQLNPIVTSLVIYDTTNGTVSSGRLIKGEI